MLKKLDGVSLEIDFDDEGFLSSVGRQQVSLLLTAHESKKKIESVFSNSYDVPSMNIEDTLLFLHKKGVISFANDAKSKIERMNRIPFDNVCPGAISFSDGKFVFDFTIPKGIELCHLVEVLLLLHGYYKEYGPSSRENSLVYTALEEAFIISKMQQSKIREIADYGSFPDFFSEFKKSVDLIGDDQAISGSVINFNYDCLVVFLQIGHRNEDGSIFGCFGTHLVDIVKAYCVALINTYGNGGEYDVSGFDALNLSLYKIYDCLVSARVWLEARKYDRAKRKVLGTDKK